MLEVRDLKAFYGQAQVISGVSFSVESGSVTALLGRNGAGKSTILKSIMGLVRCQGSIRLDSRPIMGLPHHRLSALGLGYVPEERRIFTGLTVLENLEVGRRPARNGQNPWTPERLFELFPNLESLKHRRGGQISGGEQQMLSVARTLMGNPRFLLLDEPSEGLAPRIIEQMAEALSTISRDGLTVLLSEQNLEFARRVSDHAMVIVQGRLAYDGPIETIMTDTKLRRETLSL